jgi:Gas vesicle synthesis protein GvpL/GvpF
MADALVYVYAVSVAELAGPDELSAVPGVDGAPVRVVAEGGLTAVVSSVDPGRFGEEALRRNLEDLRWLENAARAHHGVVQAAGRHHPVAPVRLATIYVDDDGVRALLAEHAQRFAAALERVRGRIEWGVKGFAVARRDDENPDPAPDLGPGAAYLMRKRAAGDRARTQHRLVREAAEDAHRALAALAVVSRRYPPQDPRLTGRHDEMVLNAAYLVEESASRQFRDAVERWGAAEVRLELTGPWAPYSFAALEDQ